MKRYVVVCTDQGSEGINLFKDKRSFANKSTARQHRNSANYFYKQHFEIQEIEVESDKEKIDRLEKKNAELMNAHIELVADRRHLYDQFDEAKKLLNEAAPLVAKVYLRRNWFERLEKLTTL